MALPTLCDLVAQRSLALRQLVAAPDGRTVIASVHVTDLDHPGRYLLPDELVLTNGLWSGRVGAEAWVAELVTARVTALGVGLGTPLPAVPADLVAACRDAGLPLVEVPEAVSFAQISRFVVDRAAQDRQRALRQQLDRNRALLRVVAEGGGVDGLLHVLRRDTGLDAAVVGPGGRVVAHVGSAPTEEQARQAEAAARRAALPVDLDAAASAFGAGITRYPSRTLLVGEALADLDDARRAAVEQVVAYAALEDAREHDERGAGAALVTEFLDLLRAGELPRAAVAARLHALGLDPDGPLAVIAADNELAALRYALCALDLPHVAARYEGCVVALVAVGDAANCTERPVHSHASPLDGVTAVVRAGEEEPVMGGGRSGRGAEELRRGLAEALSALAVARERPAGQRVVGHLDVGSHALLLELLDRPVLDAFRESVLGPLERWDAERGTDLVGTLRAFLATGGRWRVTGQRLHIHHNTLRHRLERVEALTGRRLDSTAARVDFHLALTAAAAPLVERTTPPARLRT